MKTFNTNWHCKTPSLCEKSITKKSLSNDSYAKLHCNSWLHDTLDKSMYRELQKKCSSLLKKFYNGLISGSLGVQPRNPFNVHNKFIWSFLGISRLFFPHLIYGKNKSNLNYMYTNSSLNKHFNLKEIYVWWVISIILYNYFLSKKQSLSKLASSTTFFLK